jgi:hypothetical protein
MRHDINKVSTLPCAQPLGIFDGRNLMRESLLTAVTLVVAQAIVIAQVNGLRAQSCSLNGKQVEFSGKLCIRGNCSIVHQKVRFLGNKILFYQDISKDEGTIFQLGHPTELKDANSAWRPSGPPGSTELSIASAEQRDGNLSLTIDNKWSQSGNLIGHAWRNVGIDIANCSSCEVSIYEFNFDSSTGPGFRSTFSKYVCRVYD